MKTTTIKAHSEKVSTVMDSGCTSATPKKAAARRGPHRLVNARTHVLEGFRSSCPPYAILSHTWGAEELTLQDWQAGSNKDFEGYHKVIGTCERALHDGFGYVWVDTCCIDKTNQVELSEAINSMFKWYQDAKVCYVLLSDLHVDPAEQDDDQWDTEQNQERDDTEQVHVMSPAELRRFDDSKYFTRGWTLQEMLAAQPVRFFAADGTYLGDLEALAEQVANATGVDASLLADERSLADFTIPQKMSWASDRRTTRVEDRAYSLLGILNVSLDLRYGDGEDEFVRLQKELLKQRQGIQVLAWNRTESTRQPCLLADRPEDFRDCSGITCDQQGASTAEVWATNVGIRGSLLVLQSSTSAKEQQSEYLVALDCYQEAQPDKILALRLDRCPRSHGSSVFAIAPARSSESSEAAENGNFCFAELTFDEYPKARPMDMTILWDGSNALRQSSWAPVAGDSARKAGSPALYDEGRNSIVDLHLNAELTSDEYPMARPMDMTISWDGPNALRQSSWAPVAGNSARKASGQALYGEGLNSIVDLHLDAAGQHATSGPTRPPLMLGRGLNSHASEAHRLPIPACGQRRHHVKRFSAEGSDKIVELTAESEESDASASTSSASVIKDDALHSEEAWSQERSHAREVSDTISTDEELDQAFQSDSNESDYRWSLKQRGYKGTPCKIGRDDRWILKQNNYEGTPCEIGDVLDELPVRFHPLTCPPCGFSDLEQDHVRGPYNRGEYVAVKFDGLKLEVALETKPRREERFVRVSDNISGNQYFILNDDWTKRFFEQYP